MASLKDVLQGLIDLNTKLVTKVSSLITGKADKDHSHDDKYYTESEIDTKVDEITDEIQSTATTLQTAINGKANSVHNHDDRYYTESEIDTKLAGKSGTEHTHDGRYYTETEMDAKLATKSDTSHNHDGVYYKDTEIDDIVSDLQADIDGKAPLSHGTHVPTPQTANNAKFLRNDNTWQTVTPANIGAAPTSHGNHVPTTQTANSATFLRNDNTWQKVTPANIGAAEKVHNHDDLYYTKTGVDEKVDDLTDAIATKAATGHTHDDRYFTETEINNKLAGYSTTSHNHDDKYYTETEIDSKISTINTNVSNAEKNAKAYADTKITALVNSAPDAMNTLGELADAIADHEDVYEAYVAEMSTKLAGKSDTTHTHDDRYYTETEIDSKITTINNTITENVNTLQTAINGKANSSHGTHVTWATNAPKANGTAAVGTVARVAREDHVHPLQTTVSGNAGTATKLQTGRTITIGNQSNTFDGSGNISYSLSSIGAAPTSHSHDDKYYTETEVDALVDGLEDAINKKANSSHTHTVLSLKNDNFKDASALPSTYERGETLFFSNSPESNKFNNLTYGLVQTLKEYTSGSAAWQFLYPYNASDDKFYVRNAQYGTDSWRAWAMVYTSLNKPTPSDIGAAPTNHNHNYAGSSSAGGAANTAVKLQTARSINGTNFDGSGNITTANWGTARNIYIADSDATNTGAAVSVNGSGNVTLKLPSTIKAGLSGNASSATKLQTARNIVVGNKTNSFDGTGNITFTLADIGVGALTDLTTATQTSIVGAVNEVHDIVDIDYDAMLTTITTLSNSI